MDKTAHYRQIIKDLLTKYAGQLSQQPENGIATRLIFDEARDEYLWLQTGWSRQHRVHGVTVHIGIRDHKIWIEQDWTEDGIATDLLNAGVPNEDIVLAFYDPETRSLTEFAVA